jgi:hypothetical protein
LIVPRHREEVSGSREGFVHGWRYFLCFGPGPAVSKEWAWDFQNRSCALNTRLNTTKRLQASKVGSSSVFELCIWTLAGVQISMCYLEWFRISIEELRSLADTLRCLGFCIIAGTMTLIDICRFPATSSISDSQSFSRWNRT